MIRKILMLLSINKSRWRELDYKLEMNNLKNIKDGQILSGEQVNLYMELRSKYKALSDTQIEIIEKSTSNDISRVSRFRVKKSKEGYIFTEL